MNNFYSIISIGIILLALLFLFLVFPGMDMLNNVPSLFQTILYTIIFIGIASYFVYLFIELKSLYNQLMNGPEKSNSKTSTRQHTGPTNLDLNIDPQKNYKLLTSQLLNLLRSSLAGNTAFLYLYNKNQNKYILQDYKSRQEVELVKNIQTGGSIYSEIINKKSPKIYNSSQFDNTYLIYYQNPKQISSLMLIPVIVNEFVGIIGIDSQEEEKWNQEDAQLAKNFSEMFSQFVWQVDSIEIQANKMTLLKDLTEFHQFNPLEISLLDFYKKTSELIEKYLYFDRLLIYTKKRKEKTLSMSVEFVAGEETDLKIGDSIRYTQSLPRLIETEEDILISDYDKTDLDFRFKEDDMEELKYRSCIGIHLPMKEGESGGIVLESFSPHQYDQQDLNLLSYICDSIDNLATQMKEHKKIEDLATLDGLTQLYNHRAFKNELKDEIERCRRYDNTLTLMILDIDDFKEINDTHGHLFGDFVLEKLSKVIRGSIRSIDTVARYGGEEFAIILINAKKEDCIKTGERIRSNVENFIFKQDGTEINITISIGIASFPKDGEDYKEIISNADEAMYDSKQAGKNQVTIYENE